MKLKTITRSGRERRVAQTRATFPLRDKKGILVLSDRRVCADRRSNGLDVTESQLSKEEFNKYFASAQDDG